MSPSWTPCVAQHAARVSFRRRFGLVSLTSSLPSLHASDRMTRPKGRLRLGAHRAAGMRIGGDSAQVSFAPNVFWPGVGPSTFSRGWRAARVPSNSLVIAKNHGRPPPGDTATGPF